MKKMLLIVIAMTSYVALAQSQRDIYDSALRNYAAGEFNQSCSDFRQLYESSNQLQQVDASVLDMEKTSMMRGFDWQKKAFASDNQRQWAKECSEWYHSALRNRADEDMMLTGNALEYAHRAEKNLFNEQQDATAKANRPLVAPSGATNQTPRRARTQANPQGCASDDAMQKSVKLVFPCVDTVLRQARSAKQAGQTAQAVAAYQRLLQVNHYAGFQRSYDVDKEAHDYLNQNDAARPASQTQAGTGTIPSGTYKCYAATTATVLAGGSAELHPGNWGGDIQIKGDTYLYGSNPWGRYKVGTNGKITWMGGGYSATTLGRYILDRGEPAIVIGWADADAGQICKR